MRTSLTIEANCEQCCLQHRTEITPWFLEQNSRFLLNDALQQAEDMFLVDLVDEDGWADDGERLLCQRCARKVEAEKEKVDA